MKNKMSCYLSIDFMIEYELLMRNCKGKCHPRMDQKNVAMSKGFIYF